MPRSEKQNCWPGIFFAKTKGKRSLRWAERDTPEACSGQWFAPLCAGTSYSPLFFLLRTHLQSHYQSFCWFGWVLELAPRIVESCTDPTSAETISPRCWCFWAPTQRAVSHPGWSKSQARIPSSAFSYHSTLGKI